MLLADSALASVEGARARLPPLTPAFSGVRTNPLQTGPLAPRWGDTVWQTLHRGADTLFQAAGSAGARGTGVHFAALS